MQLLLQFCIIVLSIFCLFLLTEHLLMRVCSVGSVAVSDYCPRCIMLVAHSIWTWKKEEISRMDLEKTRERVCLASVSLSGFWLARRANQSANYS